MSTRPSKPKRAHCHVCLRKRFAKFIEWHPGVMDWQCKPSEHAECDRRFAARLGPIPEAWSDDFFETVELPPGSSIKVTPLPI